MCVPFLGSYVDVLLMLQVNQAVNGVITSYDVLAEMLESMEHLFDRLRIYAETSMPAVDPIVVKLMVELISTLALVSRKLEKRRHRESFAKMLHATLLSAT